MSWSEAFVWVGFFGMIVGISWAVAWRYKDRPTEDEVIYVEQHKNE